MGADLNAILQQEQRWRTYVQNSSDLMMVLDAAQRIAYVSPSCHYISGYDFWQLSGQPFSNFIHPDDLSIVTSALNTLLETPEERVQIICRFRHQNGQWRYFELVGQNWLQRSEIGGIVLNTRDISDRLQTESILQAILLAWSHPDTTFLDEPELDT